MKAPRSPFRPTFGVNPPSFQGRERVVDAVADALEEGAGAAARISLVTGVRGIGKTIVLNAVEDEARQRGWLVVSESMTTGLLDRLTDEHVPQAWREVRAETPPDPTTPERRRQLSGLTVTGLGGATFAPSPAPTLVGLRSNLTALCDEMGRRGSGVLISLDEIHRSGGRAREELQTLTTIVQHLWREDRSIAFVAAGLPSAIHEVLTDRVMTFLRRAERFELDLLTADEAEAAIREPVVQAGRGIDDVALDRAVATAAGYPFLVQLVGDLAWRHQPDSSTITASQVEAVAQRAVRELGAKVHRPAVAELSDQDIRVLRAMLVDPHTSAAADLLRRLDVDHPWLSRYRRRLLAAGLVRAEGRGRLAYALPYLRDYLSTLPL